jgi:hypothetical protein
MFKFDRVSKLEKILKEDDDFEDVKGWKRKIKYLFSKPHETATDIFVGYVIYQEAKKGFDEGLTRYTSFFEKIIDKNYLQNLSVEIHDYLKDVHETGLFNHIINSDYGPFIPYLSAGLVGIVGGLVAYNVTRKWGEDPLIKHLLEVRKEEIEKKYDTLSSAKFLGVIPSSFKAWLGLQIGDYREIFDEFIEYQKKEKNNFIVNSVLCDLYFDAMYKLERNRKKSKKSKKVLNAQNITDKYGELEFYFVLLKRYIDGWTKDRIKTKKDNTVFYDGLMYELKKNKLRRKINPDSEVLNLQALHLDFLATNYNNFFRRFSQLMDYDKKSYALKLLPTLSSIIDEDKDFYEKSRTEFLEFEKMKFKMPLFTMYADNLFLTITRDSKIPYKLLGQSVELLYNMSKKFSDVGYEKIIRIENTKNKVYFYPHSSELTQIMFKESESYAGLRIEFVTSLKRKELIKNIEDIEVPDPIIINEVYSEKQKSYVYLSQLIQGETFDDVIKNNSSNIENVMEKILKYAAIIHNNEFDLKLVNRYLGKEVKQKFSGESLSDIVFEIIDSLSVLNNFTDNEKSVVLDLHGGNFIYGVDEKLYAIDHERNYVSAVTDDLSRLFHLVNGRINIYGNKQKNIEYEHFKEVYLWHLDGKNIFFEPEKFDLCFLKSNIRNTFSLYSYFSQRADIFSLLNNYLIDVSINSIDEIKEKHEKEYKKNKEQYDRINETLLRINHTIIK